MQWLGASRMGALMGIGWIWRLLDARIADGDFFSIARSRRPRVTWKGGWVRLKGEGKDCVSAMKMDVQTPDVRAPPALGKWCQEVHVTETLKWFSDGRSRSIPRRYMDGISDDMRRTKIMVLY